MDRADAARELGVSYRASASEVEQAFRRAARSSHPDLGGNPATFRRVTEARQVMLRPAPPADPLTAAVTVMMRYHPLVRALGALVRAAERRPVR